LIGWGTISFSACSQQTGSVRLTLVPSVKPVRNGARFCTRVGPAHVRAAFPLGWTFVVTFAPVNAVGYCPGHGAMPTFS
jgi:hypothetical protein